MMIKTNILALSDFLESNPTLTILLVLGLIVGAAFYLKKIFPKIFDNKEGLKTQDELDKEDFESLIQTHSVEKNDDEYEYEEETYFINDSNREKLKKMKEK